MTPLYDGQENHYKKMLELQEKLRKSEEERIRLEERFNVLVQQSQNRHQACINNLRIRYVEFLEEQKARDERNNKILGALNKVDNSLALMTAKTETLNILRKQYEAYLLRTYGNQRPNGSTTADSGLGSQNEQEVLSTTIFLRPTQTTPKNTYFPRSKDAPKSNVKTSTPDYKAAKQPNLLENLVETPYNLSTDFSRFEDPNYLLNYPDFLTSYPDTSFEHVSIPKITVNDYENSIKNLPTHFTRKPEVKVSTSKDLDAYIEKIRRMHVELLQSNERDSERSHEDLDHEQNTSGDLLNVTLSDDGFEPSAEEEVKKEKRRLFDARQAYAAQKNVRPNVQRSLYNEFAEKLASLRNASDFERRSDPVIGEGIPLPTIGKFSRPEIATHFSQQDVKAFGQQRVQQPTENTLKDNFAKIDESERIIQETKNLLAADRVELTKVPESPSADADASDQEFNDDADNCIVDDYDHSVDIDSWMPDDLEQQTQEVHLADEIRDRPRRQLESIEEVDQTEDEDPVDEANDDKQVYLNESRDSKQVLDPDHTDEQKVSEHVEDQSPQGLLQEDHQNQVDDPKETYGNDEVYTNDQQYYEQNNNGQTQYQENSEYYQNYEQQQNAEQQQYEYPNDSNQQYAYDENAQYTDYENQQYTEGQYDYNDPQYQQYDPNQAYEQDPNQTYEQDPNQAYEQDSNQMYQQDSNQATYQQDPNQEYQQYGEYEGYDDKKQYLQESNNKDIDGNDYLIPEKPYAEQQAMEPVQSNEVYNTDDPAPEHEKEQVSANNYEEQIHYDEPPKSQNKSLAGESNTGAQQSKKASTDNKAKKDVIKSILDSDSDSFIERNLSNTESDFDFN